MEGRPVLVGIVAAAMFFACLAEFKDELLVYEEECLGEKKFFCSDGECISQDQYCDGRTDCKDGSDEHFCPGHHIDENQCNSTHEYLCLDKSKCIPLSWVCNGYPNCVDGSDELACNVTAPILSKNGKCKGFECAKKCISWMWVCDGINDCEDQEDENNITLCKITQGYERPQVQDGKDCDPFDTLSRRQYPCLDHSFCLPVGNMCDGMTDCRDGSDEGPFCANWTTMCTSMNCSGNATCRPDRLGPSCECGLLSKYSDITHSCVDIDECLEPFPKCSQKCFKKNNIYTCSCEEGYTLDRYNYRCFASEPEPLIFFATRSEINYYKLKSKEHSTVVSGVKQAHGVAFDGDHLYWVETAQGHQAIVRASLVNIQGTKETLVALGLEDPGSIALDWLSGLIYFTDAERGHIAACISDGSLCTILNTTSRHPKFIVLHPQVGEMYWADWKEKPVIMHAYMDGSHPVTFVEDLSTNPTGLAIDIPNGRLYFVDRHIYAIRLDGKGKYLVVYEDMSHPFSLAVFENSVYWSDWVSNSLQACDKVQPSVKNRKMILPVNTPVFGIHIYHPLLMRPQQHPCQTAKCSDMCLLAGQGYSCACAEGRKLISETTCAPSSFRELPQFLIVAGGSYLTSIRHGSLGNPESRATRLNIGRVQAMAYNSFKRILYIYDGLRKTINQINMNELSRGESKVLEHRGLDNVVDMDYDFITDALYVLDAGRRFIEVISLKNRYRALLYRFKEQEIPVSITLLPDYGKLLVAVIENELNNEVHVDGMGLDGKGRFHVISNGLVGPHVRLRYSRDQDLVYLSDEGNGVIDHIHPTGSVRENFRSLSTTVTSLAVSDSLVFWTDRRTPRLFWSNMHETGNKIRRIDLSIFPNHTQLHLQSTFPPLDINSPLMQHPCFVGSPCSHICVQIAHPTPLQVPMEYYMGYSCLCPPGLRLVGSKCEKLAHCHGTELYCHGNNTCAKGGWCDGVNDCPNGEDEATCVGSTESTKSKCSSQEKICDDGICVNKNVNCNAASTETPTTDPPNPCSSEQFRCSSDSRCIERWQMCDKMVDCADESDEQGCDYLACRDWEFMCASGNCIMDSWRCDGDVDCPDESDEAGCENVTCTEDQFQCKTGNCIDIVKQCDDKQDCVDNSDEEHCNAAEGLNFGEMDCGENEYTCSLNRSICLPLTARCNDIVECPGGTDEYGCSSPCELATQFRCEQEEYCISRRLLCDGVRHCRDGSDEAAWNCPANKTQTTPIPPLYPAAECHHGFLCKNGQCLEWSEVCDQTPNCFDGSDENGHCFTACENHNCDFVCQPTPTGARCLCGDGFTMDNATNKCIDVDECALDICSQKCQNVPGSFFCSCFHGYALRSNRRTCKAIRGNMSILYVSGNSVRSISSDGHVVTEYNDQDSASIDDMDYNVRKDKLYVTSSSRGQLIQVNSTQGNVIVTNVGRPTKVAVEWVTGNVYFVDGATTAGGRRVRVCNVPLKRCAALLRLQSHAQVTAFIVDPANGRMFYCLTEELESVVWSASLSGQWAQDLATVRNCTGLAVDSFRQRLYVAEIGPARITQMNYEGLARQRLLKDDPNLQAPHHLAIFEDHIYFLVANSYKLNRCNLHGLKSCEPYIYRVFEASTFVIRHESVQRSDIVNLCSGFECDNICALGDNGPVCVCVDGTVAKDGVHCTLEKSEMPLFNGWTAQDIERVHSAFFGLMTTVIVTISALLGLFLLYHFVYKPRRDSPFATVRFQNMSNSGCDTPNDNTPSGDAYIELPTTGSSHQAFINPIQYMRNVWQHTFQSKPRRPIGRGGLRFILPESGDTSDRVRLRY